MSDIRFNRWLHQSGTGGVYQDSSGRVGIGTSVPTSALDVQSGTIKIGSNTLSSTGVSTFTTVNATTVNTTSIVGVTTAGITTAYIGSVNDGPLSGARNRIINGSMDIWQRGTSTTATGSAYLADRWAYQFTTGGTVSQTATAPTGSRYAWNYTASASNSYLQMGQQIEYANCLDLQGQTVTISFVAKANNSNAGSTGLIVRTRTSASIDSAIYFSGTNVDSTVTLTTSYAKYSVTRTLPSSFGSLSLEFTIGSHISGDGFSISQVQLEPGTVATPFERRSYGQELALAQRYCQLNTASHGKSDGAGGIGAFYIPLQPSMRSTPTATLVTGTNRVDQIYVSRRTVASINSAFGEDTAGTAISYTLNVTSLGANAQCALFGGTLLLTSEF